MSRLFLVRHGPTHVKAMVGWTDVKADLTDAAALARLRASLPQKALMVSSDLRRAIDTADALQLRQTRLPHAMGLREMHFGEWEMKTFNDVNATDPDGIFAFYDTPGDVAPPKGESWNMFSARVDTAIDTLPEKMKSVMSMYYRDNMKMCEIGARLNITESRVSQIHTNAVSRLRRMLNPSDA